MLVFNTGTISGSGKSAINTYAPINLSANGSISLVGSPSSSSYLGMLFFEDRSAPALSHTLGGGGAMTLQGTIYLNNTLALMAAGTRHTFRLSATAAIPAATPSRRATLL